MGPSCSPESEFFPHLKMRAWEMFPQMKKMVSWVRRKALIKTILTFQMGKLALQTLTLCIETRGNAIYMEEKCFITNTEATVKL